MKCPHCLISFHEDPSFVWLGQDSESMWAIRKDSCPNPKCKKDIFQLVSGNFTVPNEINPSYEELYLGRTNFEITWVDDVFLIRPKGISISPVPSEVPTEIAEDYIEACLVLSDSPKASAALSRRCLQHILREKGGFIARTLDAEIQMALDSKTLPTYLADSVDSVRNIGNFAAHPIKSQQSGEILPVEPGEAEWNLEVIEMLFDFYFVQPERTRLRQEALNQKLQEAGKPPMK
ncbi:MAG TPA: DUF4145 domain-containing protein [Saprospiraceae bacterium]|nr:DUF4145 domain-containing protein [Saprospiraceae bacterium]